MFQKHYIEYQLRHNLQHLILHVTNRCNCRCKHCFVDFTNPQDLPLDVCQSLAKQVGRLFWLDIGGGEPFLRNDLPEIVSAFDASVVMIPSNGVLRERTVELVKTIRKSTNSELAISLSLDGMQQTNDSIRGDGGWDAVWSTFEDLRGIEGVSVKINTVLTRENSGEILDLMDEVKKHKPDMHSVILLRGNPRDSSVLLPPADELTRLGPEILRRLGNYDYGRNPISARILRNYHRYQWKLSLSILEEKRQVIPCLSGSAHMVVLADGSVSSCEMLPSVGNVTEQSWGTIMQSGAFKNQLRSIREKKCYCTHNCALLDSILFRPASVPHLLVPSRL